MRCGVNPANIIQSNMKILCFVLVLISASFALGVYIPFDVCGDPVFVPDSVSIAPKPVKIGGRLLVRIRGTAGQSPLTNNVS